MRKALWMAAVGAIALTGCAGDRYNQRPQTTRAPAPAPAPAQTQRPAGEQEPDTVARVKQEVERESDEAQPGRILTLAPEEQRLILNPFEEAAGDAYFHLPADVPVFGEAVGTRYGQQAMRVLEEGTPVNVHFDRRDDQRFPVVTGIEVLTDDRAQELDRQM